MRCVDPCPGSCAYNALCTVQNHIPSCHCPEGYIGDPFTACQLAPKRKMLRYVLKPILTRYFNNSLAKPIVKDDPCNPSPCGSNAVCNNGQCSCLPEYQGDPYVGCRPECVLNTECPSNKACIRNKCVDPCPGTCGYNALCDVYNHVPMCRCPHGMTGNAFVQCDIEPQPVVTNPCQPSPCGPNSRCRVYQNTAVCSCIESYIGNPPSCRPECTINSDCAPQRACQNQKCVDPCPGSCGLNALCNVVNHAPICNCPARFTGNPFVSCQPIIEPPRKLQDKPNPCIPSPCGPNSDCRVVGDSSTCACLAQFIGSPPNCRPECVSNSECPSNRACINQKCQDPCPGVCGQNALCNVVSHTAMCTCAAGFTGDPFTGCTVPPVRQMDYITPCQPNPCGSNAVCRQVNNAGSCQCLPEYFGNPYEGCRPECVSNSDCPSNRACVNQKCRDPCPGTCGLNALCSVVNHLPTCQCMSEYVGDPYQYCQLPEKRKSNECYKDPLRNSNRVLIFS